MANYVLEHGQVWKYDGKIYRLIEKQRGRVRLLRIDGPHLFRTVDEMELIDSGILKSDYDEVQR